ncbi:hypothetical protein H5410_046309 [Solanum commersonii]|uniref:Uncharacterized protein n=1 Tax=Solanum commersonii TaxID=4109 RepID=A0A9J5XBW9_SOLCO|nr:hypothetical protein H5410_046309 [Solanum commersonii]
MNYRQQELTVQDLAQFVAELAQPQANIQELRERPAAMFHIPEVEESKRKDLFIDLLGDELPKVTSKVSVVKDEKEKRREEVRTEELQAHAFGASSGGLQAERALCGRVDIFMESQTPIIPPSAARSLPMHH